MTLRSPGSRARRPRRASRTMTLDGGVTAGDIGAFFTDFEQGLPGADVDLDGGVTGGDIATFFEHYEAGC